MKFRKYILLFLLLISTVTGFAQAKSHELGIFLGGSYYIGDLNPTQHFHLIQPAGGILYRYNYNKRISFRGNATFGMIQGDDAQSDELSQQQRNLSFTSNLLEVSAMAEFNFFDYALGDPKGTLYQKAQNDQYLFTPYVFVGIGGFYFNPSAKIGNSEYALQPLATEGQGLPNSGTSKYKLFQVSIPFGVGVKLVLAKNIGLGIEWGMRKTFTDYLDDVSTVYANPVAIAQNSGLAAAILADRSNVPAEVSNIGRQRGDSSTNDWYNFTGITLTFKLSDPEHVCSSYRGNKVNK